MQIYDFEIGEGHCVLTAPFKNSTRVLASLYTSDQVGGALPLCCHLQTIGNCQHSLSSCWRAPQQGQCAASLCIHLALQAPITCTPTSIPSGTGLSPGVVAPMCGQQISSCVLGLIMRPRKCAAATATSVHIGYSPCFLPHVCHQTGPACHNCKQQRV
jgi:hypothetical protein